MTDLLSNPVPEAEAVRDFSRPRTRKLFTISPDTFEAASVLPGDVFARFVTRYNDRVDAQTYQEQHDAIKGALELALLPDSFKRFAERLQDKANPIDDGQMAEVCLWLLEEYGLRPTKPSQLSSDGSPNPESGMSSTDVQLPAESTPEVSPPTGS